MARLSGLLTLLLLPAAVGPSPADGPDRGAAFDGVWRFAAWEVEGEQAPASALEGFRWAFKGKEAVWSSPKPAGGGAAREEKFRFETDPGKSPKWIDLTPADGPGRAAVRGIYEFDGGRLRPPGQGRPAAFRAGKGSGLMLITLERIKGG
jgi:uncharacterized protein (TIGR03067 family)